MEYNIQGGWSETVKGESQHNDGDFLWGLHWRRREAGLSQADVAEESGVSRKQISRYETCRVKPHPSTVKRLATALNCRVKDLFTKNIET